MCNMKTISVMNVKGGVGKTVSAVNLAEILAAEYGKSVLVIDADPQGDATYMLAPDNDPDQTGLYGLLALGALLQEAVVETRYRGIDLVPGSTDLVYLEMEASARITASLGGILERSGYDVVLIDCPPSFGPATVAALSCADLVLIPVAMDALSIRGGQLLLTELEAVHEIAPTKAQARILPTMYHRCEACDQALRYLDTQNLPHTRTAIRRTDKVPESTFYAQLLGEYSPRSSAGRDYRMLTEELAELLWKEA